MDTQTEAAQPEAQPATLATEVDAARRPVRVFVAILGLMLLAGGVFDLRFHGPGWYAGTIVCGAGVVFTALFVWLLRPAGPYRPR
jgi:hypothetical protein